MEVVMPDVGNKIDARKLTTIEEFGVESSIRSILHPRAWRAAARGFQWRGLGGALAPRENHLGQPADFLIGTDGTVLARKYGAHADDQWSVDEVLELAAG
jgi:hypothetical protein